MIIEVGIVCGSAVAVAGMVFVYKLVRLEQEPLPPVAQPAPLPDAPATSTAPAPAPAAPDPLKAFKTVGRWYYTADGKYRQMFGSIYWHEWPSAEKVPYGSPLHTDLESRWDEWNEACNRDEIRKAWGDA